MPKWGSSGEKTESSGVPAGTVGNYWGNWSAQKRSNPVDFRKQRGIYVLYSDYKIIYIGQAGKGNASLFSRLKRHTRDDLAERWDRFSWFGLDPVLTSWRLAAPTKRAAPNTETILNHIEGILIHAAEPPLSRQGGSFGPDVERYRQYHEARKSLRNDQFADES
ncbi:MAG: hypothetical protein Phyf2KO_17390 [Phycisphaerales bacterium]